MIAAARYEASLSEPFYRIEGGRLDLRGWQYSRNTQSTDEVLDDIHGLIRTYAEAEVLGTITVTYCEPLIHSVPTTSLHKYGPAGDREARRRAAL